MLPLPWQTVITAVRQGCHGLRPVHDAAHMTNGKKIKAAGGIASLQDAEDFLKLGADRLGTSRIVKAVKELEAKGEL